MDWISTFLIWVSGFICGVGSILILVFRPELSRAVRICTERTKDLILDKKLDLKLWMQKKRK